MTLEVNGNSISIDGEGYLTNPEDWNEEVARQLALGEELELTDLHWKVVKFMRDYYNEHQIAADVRYVVKYLVEELGLDKKEAKKRLFELFPYGYVKQACKVAGMRRPRTWSTG
ncbi:TusE/DsrC/DsvC family sulfur relay protein [Candidatus Parabeggiatoa sp. HSG14]|uniref:TusE/DsrC/DsvC family sulfur relay protein n=1 Tax=Candidatus Parabeggiatoa sp. HSG14 TaxID=3055593 RepID=UPI0025A8B688|nr:TusE/DsrC/DsvC family sulfur relay protein [Thiotrichales bacterium HSG14]